MSITAILLITASAISHAFWNFTSKRRRPSLAFFFVTSLSAALLLLPLLIWRRGLLPALPPGFWLLVLATGAAQLVYFFGLAGAYRRGDISLAYPLSRALPVLLVAMLTALLRQGAAISRPGLAGMVLITLGCLILPLPHFRRLRLRHYLHPVYLLALVAALGTTGYTLLDDQALRQLRALFGARLGNSDITLFFIALQAASTALMLGVGTAVQPAERRALRALLADHALRRAALLTGVVIMGTYGLVLAAMAYVTNVSYVAAFRQLSIPLGALLGLTLQGEPRYPPKLLGIGLVTVGLLLVGLG